MKGEAKKLIRLFDGSDKKFIIPLYQRNYDWKEENCNQLFNDLIKLHDTRRESHFFGSIVSKLDQGTGAYYVIDGQQRITTVSLLLIAMVNAVKAGDMKTTNMSAEQIFDCFLVNKYDRSERKVKLKPIKKDMEAFDALLYKSSDQYVGTSNVTRNYEFLYDKAVESKLTVDELFEAVSRLEIIHIQLEDKDDPQLIFESLNSTGLDLSEADKIRNYLLMSLTPADQERLYNDYWNPIEENTDYEPTSFIRDYLTMKQGRIGRISNIYFIFKDFAEKEKEGKEALMKDMHHYSKIYRQVAEAGIGADKLNRKLHQLGILDSAVAYPFFLPFFDYAERKSLSEDAQYKVLDIVEAYWARRIICNYPSNALNKVFATLHRDVTGLIEKTIAVRGKENEPGYTDVLTYILLRKESTSAFPIDEEVRDEFAVRQIYKIPTAQRMFIFERLENQNSNETHDVVGQLESKKISIEHIMPQTLTDEWKKALGSDWERIHRQYLHTIANLTLTGYNSEYKNLPFTTKRDTKNGFKDSAFRLNNFVKNCDKWTEDELTQRYQSLSEVFFNLWPMPVSTFVPAEQEVDKAFLDDVDYNFTGRKLSAYIFKNVRYSAKNWKTMLLQICRQVSASNCSSVAWLCKNEKYGFSSIHYKICDEITPGMYVVTGSDTLAKLRAIRVLFDTCNIPQSDLVFEFQSGTGEDEQ